MDGAAALDNIFIEQLWRSLKYEDVYLNAYDSGAALFAGLERYFDFYNHAPFPPSLGLSYTGANLPAEHPWRNGPKPNDLTSSLGALLLMLHCLDGRQPLSRPEFSPLF
ncbi:MAG: hypothetical protein R3A44_33330 [Caldilineaceae bacterium]